MNTTWYLVDTPEAASKAAKHLISAPLLAIDTEYDSFRYFREKLCLIQIYAPDIAYVIDPMADLDLSFLAGPLQSRSAVKILHAADNDIRLLKRDYHFEFSNIFDTHRAAMLLGYKQLSLEKMIKEFLGVELQKSKKVQRSRWDKRPLSEEQLVYAVQDVTLLPALYEKQRQALKDKRMESAAREAFAKIADCKWQERSFNRRGYMKIKGYYAMERPQKELLKKLYVWRFEKARAADCAVFMFLPDDMLSDLVQHTQNLQDILPAEKFKRYGKELQQLLQPPAQNPG
ncbi:MAG TPA: ribonuclease D [Smithellaceae bacterium]|nr:ribonuclease D [Smithellaceae bacterium]